MSLHPDPAVPRAARLLAPALLLACLAGCGFQPVYGPRDNAGPKPVARALAGIEIPPIAEHSGQILHNFLISDITPRGAPARPTHRLEVFLNESESRRGLDKDAFNQRASLEVSAEFTLVDLATDRPALDGIEESIVGFNLQNQIDNIYATIVAREDAQRQALREISRRIAIRLAIFASSNLNAARR